MKRFNGFNRRQRLGAILIYLSTSMASTTHATDSDQSYTQENLPVPELKGPEDWVQPEADSAALKAAQEAARMMALPIASYQKCVKAVIASDGPAVNKQAQIDNQCRAQRQRIIEVLPEDLREFTLLNMDRRIAMVLRTMADAEGAITDSAEDMQEAVNRLSETE
jgi:hypothetical protein